MKKVCILSGGPSSEYEVSINTTKAILRYIDTEKYEISVLYIGKDSKSSIYRYSSEKGFVEKGEVHFLEVLPRLREFDVVLLAVHGEFGEDGTLQSILEYEDIKYTGSDSFSSRLCMDKYRSNLVVNSTVKGIQVAKMELLTVGDLSSLKDVSGKVLKPNRKGSSVDMYFLNGDTKEVVTDISKRYMLTEEFLLQDTVEDSLEISCGVLQKSNGEYITLPAIEIVPLKSKFFDYESKYVKGGSLEVTPPQKLSNKLHSEIQRITRDVHTLLGCRLYSRSDFLVKDEKIYYLETNTLPGLTDTSLFPQECKAIGISYSNLLDLLVENC